VSAQEEPVKPAVATTGDRPIVVASNRLPFTIERRPDGLHVETAPGGLVSAMDPVLRKCGGTWIGWPGIEMRRGEALPVADRPYAVAAVNVSDDELEHYYHGFSNETLWPLLHSMPGRSRFVRRDFETYAEINGRFAATVEEHAKGAGLVWIHDYHLMLAPRHVRETLAGDAALGFFLHVPFPPFDIFRLLPWDRELLSSLLACDLIAFHVPGYARNFLDCVERTLGARVDAEAMLVEYGDRTTRVAALPIGIEFEAFDGLARGAARQPESGRERVVLGVDRLDYTKGIPERIRAFERLLELHPEYRERIVLLQIAVPSRAEVSEYRDLKSEIDELVGAVNGRFTTATWSPIRYINRGIERERLSALYRDAEVALVTPLRDGMNLVAKEWVACQVDAPGVLILSRLAGAAETMREALLVNPYDLDGTAEAIHRALTMEEDERASRIAALRRRENRDDLDAWTSAFVGAAAAAGQALPTMSDRDFDRWLSAFMKDYRLALFLDYDGTLTPLTDHPDRAALSPEMRAVLVGCAARDDADVAIVSGRSRACARSWARTRSPTPATTASRSRDRASPTSSTKTSCTIGAAPRSWPTSSTPSPPTGPGSSARAPPSPSTTAACPMRSARASRGRLAPSSCARGISRATPTAPWRRGLRSAGTRDAPCCTSCARATDRRGRNRCA
jgi:trehalose 6-phosphate synthase/phosphatase